MSIHPLKILVPAILLTALAAGLWQRSEIAALAQRERFLRSQIAHPSPAAAGPAKDWVPATKTGARDRSPAFDPAACVDRFVAMATRHEAGQPPEDDEVALLLQEIAAATPKELARLASELRRDGVPEDLRKGLFIGIAPRLAELDPKLAAGLALEGGEGDGFHSVMRTWLARDPKAANQWLRDAVAADPPLDETRFRRLESLDLRALSLVARLAADPAGEGLAELLKLQSDPRQAALREIAASMPPAEMATVMKRLSQSPGLPDEERLGMIGCTLAGHQVPVLARQILLDMTLPPEQFRQAATTMIVSLDPVGIRAGIEWFRTSTSGKTKAEGLRGIVAKWAEQDPKASVEWVEGLADPEEKADLRAVLPGPYRER